MNINKSIIKKEPFRAQYSWELDEEYKRAKRIYEEEN